MIILYRNSFPEKLTLFNNEQLKQLMIEWKIYRDETSRLDMIKSINKYIRSNKFILLDKLQRACVIHNNNKYWFESDLKYKFIKINKLEDEIIYEIFTYNNNLIISYKNGKYLEKYQEIDSYTNTFKDNYTYADQGVVCEIIKYNKILQYLDMQSYFMLIYHLFINQNLILDLIKYIFLSYYKIDDLKNIDNIKMF